VCIKWQQRERERENGKTCAKKKLTALSSLSLTAKRMRIVIVFGKAALKKNTVANELSMNRNKLIVWFNFINSFSTKIKWLLFDWLGI